MTTNESTLFKELIIASQTLVTVCNLAAENLSEEFKDMITGPMESVKLVLARCPDAESYWGGEFRAEDCKDEDYSPDIPGQTHKGVRLTHIPTKLSIISYSAIDRDENVKRAMRALKTRVEAHNRAVL